MLSATSLRRRLSYEDRNGELAHHRAVMAAMTALIIGLGGIIRAEDAVERRHDRDDGGRQEISAGVTR